MNDRDKEKKCQYKPHTWFKHGLSLDHHNHATSKVTKKYKWMVWILKALSSTQEYQHFVRYPEESAQRSKSE